MDNRTYDIACIRMEVEKMNKQMLHGMPFGAKIQLGGKEGRLTNFSASMIFKTYEITFDDGEVITRDELVEDAGLAIMNLEIFQEACKKRDWYKSEMEDKQKRVAELADECQTITILAEKDRAALREDVKNLEKKIFRQGKLNVEHEENSKVRENVIKEFKDRLNEQIALNKNLQTRLQNAVKKAQDLTVENVTLEGRLKELDKTIVIEKGVMSDKTVEKFTEIAHDIHGSGPIGAPVTLATEIAKMLNKESIEKILKEVDGNAKVGYIAEKLNSSAKAVYRLISKTTGMFVGKLPEPDYKEENADAWLEGQQKVSEPEVEVAADAPAVPDDVESSEESGIPPEVEGADEGPEADEGGN